MFSRFSLTLQNNLVLKKLIIEQTKEKIAVFDRSAVRKSMGLVRFEQDISIFSLQLRIS